MRPYARLYWKKSSIRTVRDSVKSSWAVISRLAWRDASWTKEGWKRKNDDQMIKSFLIELGQARSWRVNHATLSPVLQPSANDFHPRPPSPLSYYRSPSHGLVHHFRIFHISNLPRLNDIKLNIVHLLLLCKCIIWQHYLRHGLREKLHSSYQEL